MFNEYEVYQLMKSRQEETERKLRDAWTYYNHSTEEKASEIIIHQSEPIVNECQCACA